jgi:hypothetical protein
MLHRLKFTLWIFFTRQGYSLLYKAGYNCEKCCLFEGAKFMVDPATAATAFTAAKITELAFQKFIESSAGELAKKFTENAIAKMDDLRKKIWARLRGKPGVETALSKVEKEGSKADLENIAAYLQVAMLEDPKFAADIQAIAHEITLEQKQDNSTMTQINYGGTNYQTKTGDNNTNFFGGTHQHGQK